MQRRVGTWTLDFSTRTVMKASREGMEEDWSKAGAEELLLVGVVGGEGRGVEGAGPHWMTSMAFSAM